MPGLERTGGEIRVNGLDGKSMAAFRGCHSQRAGQAEWGAPNTTKIMERELPVAVLKCLDVVKQKHLFP